MISKFSVTRRSNNSAFSAESNLWNQTEFLYYILDGLVTGISGQDGAYSQTTAAAKRMTFVALQDADLAFFKSGPRRCSEDVQPLWRSTIPKRTQVLFKMQPDEIYNLAGRLKSPFRSSSR
jgi:hypothetical protein